MNLLEVRNNPGQKIDGACPVAGNIDNTNPSAPDLGRTGLDSLNRQQSLLRLMVQQLCFIGWFKISFGAMKQLKT